MNVIAYNQNNIELLPSTRIKSYDAAISVFNNWLDGRNVNEENIVEYLEFCRDNYKPRTFNHKLNALKKSLKIIGEQSGQDSTLWKMKIDEVFKRVKPVKVKDGISRERFLSKEQFDKLKKVSDPEVAIILECLYQTACRVSELCNIKLSNCTIKDKYVEIEIIGKGNKQRIVFLKKSTFNKCLKTFQGQKYLFEYRVGKQADRTTIYKKIAKSGKLIGLKISPHVLRHTFATINLKRLGIHKVSKYLNHSDISITSKFYLHEEATADEILK